MKHFKSHFVFSKSQRNGIFVLVLLILVLQLVFFYQEPPEEPILPAAQQQEVLEFQRILDSLKGLANRPDTVFPFNPNFISDYKGYTLGMAPKEIDRLHAFRAEGRWVNTIGDFQKVTGISDSLLQEISPYFRFPEWVGETKPGAARIRDKGPTVPSQDLNKASAADLTQIIGVGEVLSERIVKYRARIGGFRSADQLHDVYGLAPEVVDRIGERFFVDFQETPKWDLNEISVLDLAELPYFNYELARDVIEFRKNRKRIDSFQELSQIKGFPMEKLERIELYLTIN